MSKLYVHATGYDRQKRALGFPYNTTHPKINHKMYFRFLSAKWNVTPRYSTLWLAGWFCRDGWSLGDWLADSAAVTGWLADSAAMAGWLNPPLWLAMAGWLIPPWWLVTGWLAGWLIPAGWIRRCGWLAGWIRRCGWLAGWLNPPLWLAGWLKSRYRTVMLHQWNLYTYSYACGFPSTMHDHNLMIKFYIIWFCFSNFLNLESLWIMCILYNHYYIIFFNPAVFFSAIL